MRELLKAADRANEDLKAKLAALAAAANKRRGILDEEIAELEDSADALAADLRARDAELQGAKENVLQVCLAHSTLRSLQCLLPRHQITLKSITDVHLFACQAADQARKAKKAVDAVEGQQQALAEALATAAQEAAASLDVASQSGEDLKRELEGRAADLQAAMEKARALKPDVTSGLAKERRLEEGSRGAAKREEGQRRKVEQLEEKLRGAVGPGEEAGRCRLQSDLKAARYYASRAHYCRYNPWPSTSTFTSTCNCTPSSTTCACTCTTSSFY